VAGAALRYRDTSHASRADGEGANEARDVPDDPPEREARDGENCKPQVQRREERDGDKNQKDKRAKHFVSRTAPDVAVPPKLCKRRLVCATPEVEHGQDFRDVAFSTASDFAHAGVPASLIRVV
jgi:hypothetical protein